MDRRATRPLATHAHRIRIRTPRRPRHSGPECSGSPATGRTRVDRSRTGIPCGTAANHSAVAARVCRNTRPIPGPATAPSTVRKPWTRRHASTGHGIGPHLLLPHALRNYVLPRQGAVATHSHACAGVHVDARRVTAAELSRRGSDQQQRALVTARCPSSTAQPVSPATRHCAGLGALGQAVPRPP